MKETFKLYGVIDKSTGKLVSDITNPRHKYWESKKRAEQAVKSYSPIRMTSSFKIHNNTHKPKNLEVVEIYCEVRGDAE